MGEVIRLKLTTKDRIGMVLDILKILYKYRANLKALEVDPGLICLKMDNDFNVSCSHLIDELRKQKDVFEVSQIKLLPQEKREKHMKAGPDATGEGIIAIDNKGIITNFNTVAEKILKVKAKDALGKNIADIISSDIPMLRTIVTGESYDNQEIMINTKKSKSHYITTGRPILDEEGLIFPR